MVLVCERFHCIMVCVPLYNIQVKSLLIVVPVEICSVHMLLATGIIFWGVAGDCHKNEANAVTSLWV